jgi:hypothetical protein
MMDILFGAERPMVDIAQTVPNPTIRSRNKVRKDPGSRAAGPAMAFKLIEATEERWRYINGAHLVALVRAGAKFRNGVLAESGLREGEGAARSAGRADAPGLTLPRSGDVETHSVLV